MTIVDEAFNDASPPGDGVSEFPYLIIGGTTKAGTSSLYFYLADHPEVCPANIKETRFFFNSSYYPLPARYSLADGAEKYEVYFSHCREERVRMEATPDYLYSPESARWIKETLPYAKLLFILRDPIERVVSWYRFARQQRLLPDSVTFAAYVDRQLEHEAAATRLLEQHWRALEQGRYANYLQPYFEIYGREDMLILQYADLKKDPVGLLSGVARFAGIDPAFYESYDFQVHNKTRDMRSNRAHQLYTETRRVVRMRIHDKYHIWKTMRFLRRSLEPFYLRLNSRRDKQVAIPDDLMARLKAYYADDQQRLAELLGRQRTGNLTLQPSSGVR